MDSRDRAVLTDFLLGVIWPGMERYIGSAAQTDFVLRSGWDTTYDVPIAWVNGNRVATPAWVDSTTVRLAVAVSEGDLVHVVISPGAGANYLPRSGALPMLGDLDLDGNRVENLAQSVLGHHAVRRDEVAVLALAALSPLFIARNGSQPPTAATPWGGQKLTDLAAGTEDDDAIRKDQAALLDGSQAFTAPQGGVDATDPEHLATLAQVTAAVDAVAAIPSFRWQVFTSGGTFTVPAAVRRVTAVVIGGGGGGATADTAVTDPDGGGGGGAGGMAMVTGVVAPGDELAVVVGGGGPGGTGGYLRDGSAGGASSVTASAWSASCTGGSGGISATPHSGGAGGVASATGALSTLLVNGSAGSVGGEDGDGNPVAGAGSAAQTDPLLNRPYGAGGNGSISTTASAGQQGVVIIAWWGEAA